MVGVMTFTVFAASTPTVGVSSTYGVLSSTYTDTTAGTTVNGDVGFTTGPATAPLGSHTNYGSGSPYDSAGIDQGSVLNSLNLQPCDFTFGSAQDLSLLVQPLTPGVYCTIGAQSVGIGGITLKSGTYIFRSTGALNTVANSIVSGGEECNVFWTPVATTLGANSKFQGTVIDNAGITVGSSVTWVGKALAFKGTVTTDTDTITAPSCTVITPTPSIPPTTNSKTTSGSCMKYWTGTTNYTPCYLDYLNWITPATTPTPSICTPLTNFQVKSRIPNDHQDELYWKGGDQNTNVTIFIDDSTSVKSYIVKNTGYYEAKNLTNGVMHWFWITNDCSTTVKIDPLP